jgi:acyl carrier protein
MSLYSIVRTVIGEKDAALDESSNAENSAVWDSLKNMELIFAVESAYRVRFTVKEVARLKSIGDLRRLLLAKGANVEAVDPVPEDRHRTVRDVLDAGGLRPAESLGGVCSYVE